VVVVKEMVELPAVLASLASFCPHHALPLPMVFLEAGLSDHEEPMGVYRCADHNCRYHEGWILDRHTGRPFRLWRGFRGQP
jgi:hypothetical protein